MARASSKFPTRHSSEHDIIRGDARCFASSALPVFVWFARVRRTPPPAAGSGNRENGLLREDESAIRQPRVRPPRAQARSGQAMLRRLRFRTCRYNLQRHPFRLSADRRRNFCRLHFFRANALAATSCSAAAHLIAFRSCRLVPAFARRGWKETHTGGFHEISTCDHSGPGAGRHSERDFELG